MTSVSLLTALLALSAVESPSRAQLGVQYTAPMPEAPAAAGTPQATALVDETDKLNDALANPAVSRDELHGRAGNLFGNIMRPESSAVGNVDLRGWDKPDLETSGSVEGLVDKSGNTIAEAKFKTNAEAPPAPELEDAWVYGRELHQAGMMEYDQEGKLDKGTLGAFLYTKTAALGVLFNKAFKDIQKWVGDQFAAATAVHEAAHARDHAQGELNNKEVKKGEKQAFETEYKYLRLVDPTGQKLAYARVNLCSPSSIAPKAACDYVTHLAKISWYGEKGDWDGLVSSLGYEDRPGGHDHHDGDGHPSHD
ncbi:MAG: hypothetical protein FD126_2486 [Elusimicrobia bacterium]|nr:MAG: hypothetical protein FD126_2486 [Elusimicrobiota bacterium]